MSINSALCIRPGVDATSPASGRVPPATGPSPPGKETARDLSKLAKRDPPGAAAQFRDHGCWRCDLWRRPAPGDSDAALGRPGGRGKSSGAAGGSATSASTAGGTSAGTRLGDSGAAGLGDDDRRGGVRAARARRASGTTGAAGSGTTSGGAGAGTTTGVAGATGTAGAGTAGATVSGDTPPWRDMMPSDGMRHNVRFSAKTADPDNAAMMDGASHPGDNQIAEVDASKPLKKKLCVVLPGIGNGPGQGTSATGRPEQGYHVFQVVAYANSIDKAAKGGTRPRLARQHAHEPVRRNGPHAVERQHEALRQHRGARHQGHPVPRRSRPGRRLGVVPQQGRNHALVGRVLHRLFVRRVAPRRHRKRFVRLGLGVSAVSGPRSEGHPDARLAQGAIGDAPSSASGPWEACAGRDRPRPTAATRATTP